MLMGNLRLRRCLFWLASLVWMAMIFRFSDQTATESSAVSDATLHFLLRIFRIDNMEEITADTILHQFFTFLLRKSAHLLIFGVLGMLFGGAVCQYPATRLQKIALPMALGILYACIDELHQYFVPGRACQIRDVCIDTVGVLIGILVVLGIEALLRRHRIRKQAVSR
ncbi:MAG: VanZ family protein [Clostridia bacterium]|nr:VanZ family protein [Clostridia bacterium]